MASPDVWTHETGQSPSGDPRHEFWTRDRQAQEVPLLRAVGESGDPGYFVLIWAGPGRGHASGHKPSYMLRWFGEKGAWRVVDTVAALGELAHSNEVTGMSHIPVHPDHSPFVPGSRFKNARFEKPESLRISEIRVVLEKDDPVLVEKLGLGKLPEEPMFTTNPDEPNFEDMEGLGVSQEKGQQLPGPPPTLP